MSASLERLVQAPEIVFRDDFKDSAVLYNPENDKAYSVNQIGAIIWNALETPRNVEEVIQTVRDATTAHTDQLPSEVRGFLQMLQEAGLALPAELFQP